MPRPAPQFDERARADLHAFATSSARTGIVRIDFGDPDAASVHLVDGCRTVLVVDRNMPTARVDQVVRVAAVLDELHEQAGYRRSV